MNSRPDIRKPAAAGCDHPARFSGLDAYQAANSFAACVDYLSLLRSCVGAPGWIADRVWAGRGCRSGDRQRTY